MYSIWLFLYEESIGMKYEFWYQTDFVHTLQCIGVISMQSQGLIRVANCFKKQNKPKQEKMSECAQIYLANKLHSQQANGP